MASASKIEQLRTWVVGLHAEPVTVEDDTDLVESGLLTSLQFVQMVMEIERINGTKLEPGVITIEKLRSLAAIDAAAFQAVPAKVL